MNTYQYLFAVFLIGLLSFTTLGQTLSGTVRAADGTVIEGAFLEPSGMLLSEVTNKDGTFLFDDKRMRSFWGINGRKLLFVDKEGYEISVNVVDPNQRNMDIVLSPIRSIPQEIGECSNTTQKDFKSAGKVVRITFPKKFKLKKSSNFEYSGYEIKVNSKQFAGKLSGWTGVYSSKYAPSHLINDASSFSVMRNGMGLDWRGRSSNGSYWRYIGGAYGMIDSLFYQTASVSLAEQFDAILATMCFPK